MKNTKGFTLVELMVAMGVTVLLLVAVYVAINATQRHSAGIERRVLVMQDVKPALALMSVELSMASYNRFLTNGNWLVTDSATAADNCLNASPNQNYRGIQEATANVITVEMDATGNCSSNNDPACMRDPNEVINYTYDTANERITRETNCGGNQPFLGDTAASGRPRNLRVINNTLGLPLFRYFDGAEDEIFECSTLPCDVDTLPARIPDIRRILIVLAVETEGIEPNTGQKKRLIYSTSVFVRNHAYTN